MGNDMKNEFGSGRNRVAQTFVFFILALGAIILLCGLAIDSGLLYLAKARMGRAVDGAALAAIGNFLRSSNPVTNRDEVALIIRNFAVANYTDLGPTPQHPGVSTSGGPTGGTLVGTNTYFYNFNDGTQDANGQYRRFVQVTMTTGAGGGLTSAVVNARCPVQTYFINFAGGFFRDLKVSESTTASRNPRLIMVVVDRSGSMLKSGGGAYGLPQAVIQFLDFFDVSSDYVGIVSFGSNARLEMPLTTNFINAGTNVLFGSYQLDASEGGAGVPGVDAEDGSAYAQANLYATLGVRRMKFGGTTAADDGIRLGMEQLMANSGFNDPDVVKYMVIFTDGAWNVSRTLFAAPGYTNIITCPLEETTNAFLTNGVAVNETNGQIPGPWDFSVTGGTAYAVDNTNLVPVPSMGLNSARSSLPFITNAIDASGQGYSGGYANLVNNHTNDVWQSEDDNNEPFGTAANLVGQPIAVTNTTWVGQNTSLFGTTNYYTHNLDVWLQPGSVDYLYHNGGVSNNGVYVSNYNATAPNQHINIYLASGDSNVLVMPGYVADGLFFDSIDMAYPDNSYYNSSDTTYPRYRTDNFQSPFLWYDDTESQYNNPYLSNSTERQLMFRNYVNLLTGFYVYRPDDPPQTPTVASGSYDGVSEFEGYEPLDDTTPPFNRPLNGLGAYYPSAGFYSPFDLMGLEGGLSLSYILIDPNSDPDATKTGQARHLEYSINMLSTAAAPEWSGEWFFEGTGGTTATSGTANSSVSTLISTKAQWENGAPAWLTADFDNSANIMTNEPAHNTALAVSVWRPLTFNGSNNPVAYSSISPSAVGNYTGGYVTDGNGNYYSNAMGWSGRPTHYFDFSQGKWIPVGDNHVPSIQALPLGIWKAQEYAWHARAQGVTIFTVGYGTLVDNSEQVLLAQIANATNTTAGGTTNISYNPSQPVGQQFYAQTTNDISNDFYSIGTAINAALTQ